MTQFMDGPLAKMVSGIFIECKMTNLFRKKHKWKSVTSKPLGRPTIIWKDRRIKHKINEIRWLDTHSSKCWRFIEKILNTNCRKGYNRMTITCFDHMELFINQKTRVKKPRRWSTVTSISAIVFVLIWSRLLLVGVQADVLLSFPQP